MNRQPEQQSFTQEGLAQLYQWEIFPAAIQTQLYRHYQTFTHNGDDLARADIQSASDALYWVLQGQPIERFTTEHAQYFGVDSTEDLKRLANDLMHPQQHKA